MQLLASLTCQRVAATSLVITSGLVEWIEVQVLHVNTEECIAWAKILENLTVICDEDKLEKGTKGKWSSGIVRCLTRLLDGSGESNDFLTDATLTIGQT